MCSEYKCHRCGKESVGFIMSMFNTQMICIDCSEEEEKRSDYEKAREADIKAYLNGNKNTYINQVVSQ